MSKNNVVELDLFGNGVIVDYTNYSEEDIEKKFADRKKEKFIINILKDLDNGVIKIYFRVYDFDLVKLPKYEGCEFYLFLLVNYNEKEESKESEKRIYSNSSGELLLSLKNLIHEEYIEDIKNEVEERINNYIEKYIEN